jgi:hypothetical protein
MGGHQGLELGHRPRPEAEVGVGLKEVFRGGQTQLLQPGRLGLGEGVEAEVGQRRAAPQRDGVGQDGPGVGLHSGVEQPPSLDGRPLEPGGVHRGRLRPQAVAGSLGHQHGRRLAGGPGRLEHTAEVGDVRLERDEGASRWRFPP